MSLVIKRSFARVLEKTKPLKSTRGFVKKEEFVQEFSGKLMLGTPCTYHCSIPEDFDQTKNTGGYFMCESFIKHLYFSLILLICIGCHIENENEVHFGPGPGFPVHSLDNSSEVNND